MTQKNSHTHKFKRHRFKTGAAVYFCVDEDCSYKVSTQLSLGKRNICWRCGNEFVMNEYSIRLAKPHCPDCQHRKVSNVIVEANELAVKAAKNTATDLENELDELVSVDSEDI